MVSPILTFSYVFKELTLFPLHSVTPVIKKSLKHPLLSYMILLHCTLHSSHCVSMALCIPPGFPALGCVLAGTPLVECTFLSLASDWWPHLVDTFHPRTYQTWPCLVSEIKRDEACSMCFVCGPCFYTLKVVFISSFFLRQSCCVAQVTISSLGTLT